MSTKSLRKASRRISPIRGIVFDMDGTLTEPQNWMFGEMRSVLGIDSSTDILAHIVSIPDESDRDNARRAIEDIELKAMHQMKPRKGLAQLLTYLEQHNINKTICTRNYIDPVNHMLKNFVPDIKLNKPIITRDFIPTKPSPVPLKTVAAVWDMAPENLIMVGDSIDDMMAGHSAGFSTILITSEANLHLIQLPQVHYVIDSLDEIVDYLQNNC